MLSWSTVSDKENGYNSLVNSCIAEVSFCQTTMKSYKNKHTLHRFAD